MAKHAESRQERRQSLRIKKNFILSYYDLSDPATKHRDISQLKNISLGGICFVTSTKYAPGTKMAIELKTPYLAGTTSLMGTVLESHEKAIDILFETRIKFDPLTSQAQVVLNKIVAYFDQQGQTKT